MKKRPFDTFRTVYSGVRIPYLLMFISTVCSFLLANAMIGSAVITARVGIPPATCARRTGYGILCCCWAAVCWHRSATIAMGS